LRQFSPRDSQWEMELRTPPLRKLRWGPAQLISLNLAPKIAMGVVAPPHRPFLPLYLEMGLTQSKIIAEQLKHNWIIPIWPSNSEWRKARVRLYINILLTDNVVFRLYGYYLPFRPFTHDIINENFVNTADPNIFDNLKKLRRFPQLAEHASKITYLIAIQDFECSSMLEDFQYDTLEIW